MLSTIGAIFGLTGASPVGGASEKVDRELEKDRRTIREEKAGRS